MFIILETFTISEPDMFIVFILSLLLVLPPLTVFVYLWTSVARFYDEIKHDEEAQEAHLSGQHNTMRLIGNLVLSQSTHDFSLGPRNSSLNNQELKDPIGASTKKNGINNTTVMKDLKHLTETRPRCHKNNSWMLNYLKDLNNLRGTHKCATKIIVEC